MIGMLRVHGCTGAVVVPVYCFRAGGAEDTILDCYLAITVDFIRTKLRISLVEEASTYPYLLSKPGAILPSSL